MRFLDMGMFLLIHGGGGKSKQFSYLPINPSPPRIHKIFFLLTFKFFCLISCPGVAGRTGEITEAASVLERVAL